MAERYDQESGQFVCDFISRLPTTDTGKLFNLYDWQRSALMEFYGTQVSETGTEDLPAPINAEWLRKYWYLYLEIPKKNGKSELAAARRTRRTLRSSTMRRYSWRRVRRGRQKWSHAAS